MASSFPNVSFDWLGNLPAVAEAADIRRARKESLADLQSGDADSLIAAGAKAIRAGDLEGGAKLLTLGQQRKAVDVRADELNIYRSMPGLNIPGLMGGGGAQPAAPPVGPASLPEPPATPDLFQGRPGAIPGVGPQTGLPPGASPSDAIISAAQAGGGTPPAPGPQLAGPLPTGGGAPGPLPVPGVEAFRGAAAPAVPAQAAPQIPGVEPPSAQGAQPARPADSARNIAAIASEMAKPSSKYSAGRLRALGELMKVEIERSSFDKDTKNFLTDQADRRAAGESVQSRSQWEDDRKTMETTYKSAIKKYETYAEEGQKGQSLNSVLGAMEGIVNHPDFNSGVGSPVFAQGVSALAALRDTAKTLGVSEKTLEKFGDISKLTQPAALQEAFTALSNQAIYAKLGSLGNQISEGDRNFIKLAFPSLSLTKEGNMFLIGIMKKMAQNAEQTGQVAQQYFERAGPRANPAVMDRMVREAAKDNALFVKDGKTTDVGEAVKAAVKAAREGKLTDPNQSPTPTTPAQPPTPQSVTPPQRAAPQGGQGRLLNGPKTPENPSGRYRQLPDGTIVPEGQT